MKIINTILEMQAFSSLRRKAGKKLGFVPTMGALHKGHLELVKQAVKENDVVVCSIFVNPIQFNNPDDLKKYPRTFEKDSAMLNDVGCDVIFYPSVEEMYPEPVTRVYDFGNLEKVMEGKFRPGHFNGVAVVVKKLFDIVMPQRAYFGEKDFQQLAIIKALVKMENLDVEIVPCPIVREDDGLAMSSRNVRLSPEHRKHAPRIYETLVKARNMFPVSTVAEVQKEVAKIIENEPFMQLEYFEVSDLETLEPVSENKPGKSVIGCIAVHMGDVRLIDNMIFNL
ncbi:MAG: pantoate--beta-alanine ligase [Bacteroidales bacterium]|nr:pantoate--beta-alanine ligase [Bacteroidales bacterium]